MIRFLIFRHGHAVRSAPNEERALTKHGKEQAHKLGERLTHFNAEVFYSSPLLRAKQTAEIVNQYVDLKIHFDDRLEEVGNYRMFYEIAQEEGYRQRNTLGDFNRTQMDLINFLKGVQSKDEGKTVLVSAHGNIIQALLAITIGVADVDALNKLIVANTGLTVLEWLQDNEYQLIVFNDTRHLGELIFR